MTAPLARDAFALAHGLVYVNHAVVGVLPLAKCDALHAMIDDHAARGVLGTASREAACEIRFNAPSAARVTVETGAVTAVAAIPANAATYNAPSRSESLEFSSR